MPPEIINHKSYGKDIDWYLIGVLLFEMLTGLPPYFHKSTKMIKRNILHNKLSIPDDLSHECRNLLKLLLHKDPTKRLGYKNGAPEILAHPWFEGITLADVDNKKMHPFDPYLSQQAEDAAKDISDSMVEKMAKFNVRFNRQVQKLIIE